MSEPTEDTPQQREDKADILAQEYATLEKEFRRFRSETRWSYIIVLLFLGLHQLWEKVW